MDPLVILFGFGVGILIGMTGIGGGSLMTPLLIIVIGIEPVVAIGTDLAYGAVTKTLGGWRHFRAGTVDIGVSKWLAFGSLPGAVLGVCADRPAARRLRRRLRHGAARPPSAGALLVVALRRARRALILMPALVARERDTVAVHARGRRSPPCSIGFVARLHPRR